MPTLPSGRTLGLASTINYAQLVWREQTHIVNRADLEASDPDATGKPTAGE